MVLVEQVTGYGVGAGDHMGVVPFPVGGMAAVGDVDKALQWQFGSQRPQYTQAADAAIKDANGPGCREQGLKIRQSAPGWF